MCSFDGIVCSKEIVYLTGNEGFLAAEFPTQFLAQRISRLGLYLGTNIMIWGLILAFHAACTSYAGLSVVRTLLGVFESCGSISPFPTRQFID